MALVVTEALLDPDGEWVPCDCGSALEATGRPTVTSDGVRRGAVCPRCGLRWTVEHVMDDGRFCGSLCIQERPE